jgi:hypothetical protein
MIMVAAITLPAASQPPVRDDPFKPPVDPFRGDRGYGWDGQTRSEVLARHGMVATSQPLAAEAGLDILKAGGNAFDAAVATAAMMNLVEPESAGMGGDLFMIAWSAKEKKLVALDAAGRAPSGATPERFRAKGLKSMPGKGIDSAVVPGTVDGWDTSLWREPPRKVSRSPSASRANGGSSTACATIRRRWPPTCRTASPCRSTACSAIPT